MNVNNLPLVKDGEFSFVQSKGNDRSPTSEAYGALQFAYDYFNSKLFGGRLPSCLITFSRNPRALGYFSPDRFTDTAGSFAHELSLNPQYLEPIGDYGTLNTLVHEQCHIARHEFGPRNSKGRASTTGYHDRAWADEMLRVGLIPSDTGKLGGKQTGFSMSDYPEPNGPFDLACRALLITGFKIDWRDSVLPATGSYVGRPEGAPGLAGNQQRPAGPTRTKFSCPTCRLNAWAKPTAKLSCVSCSRLMLPAI